MFNWSHMVGFDWDIGNARKSVDKHGVRQAEAEQVFFNQPLLILSDNAHSGQEPRYQALGSTDGARTLHITFTLRIHAAEKLIRVIFGPRHAPQREDEV